MVCRCIRPQVPATQNKFILKWTKLPKLQAASQSALVQSEYKCCSYGFQLVKAAHNR